MLKSEELLNKLEEVKNEIKKLQDEKEVDEAHAKISELENLKKEIEVAKAVENVEMEDIENEIKNRKDDVKMENKQQASFIRAMIKNIGGKSLTEAEKEVIQNAISGESYILPQDLSTKIREKVRDMKSFRNILPTISTSALTGAFPVEAYDSLAELVDFTDGNEDMNDSTSEIKFRQVKFALKEKAALIKLSNTLLAMTDNDLIDYVATIFAKKAVKTYNKMAIETLKTGKVAKALTTLKGLIKSLRVDIDPIFMGGASTIVTNQDGYDFLAQLEGTDGVAFLQPDLSKPAVLTVNGSPVIMFSNNDLPTVATKAPIFYGALGEGVRFVDAGKYNFAVSSEAGFTTNTTIARVIDYVDCIQVDSSDAVYCVGELTIA